MSLHSLVSSTWLRTPERWRNAIRSHPASNALKESIRSHTFRRLPHDERYDQEFFSVWADPAATRSADVMANSIVTELKPSSVVDLGCGSGALIAAIQSHDVRTLGLEYARTGIEMCRARGLDVRRFDLTRDELDERFDVAISVEVAEHLPGSASGHLVDILCSAAPMVVFTAATPGQGGTDHVNEQPHEYWIERFAQRGHQYDEARSLRWRSEWAQSEVTWWFVRNLMLFYDPTVVPRS